MGESADQDFLRSIFLMEAWDTLVALEAGVGPFADGGVPPAADELFVVTHRLKGAASLHGFPGIAALADDVGRTLDALRSASADARRDGGGRMRALIARLKTALDSVATTGHDGVEAARVPPPVAADDPVRRELEEFFAGNDEVLAYFAPEAAEHLDGMTAALLALQRDDGVDDLNLLFRAVHTLKGAAYVVGCRRVGEVAHRIEDLLVQSRDGARAMTPATIDTVFAAIDLIKLMLGMTPDSAVNLTALSQSVVVRLAESLAAAVAGPAPRVVPGPAATPVAADHAARRTIRVGLDRLDALMDLAGEMVIVRSRLERRLADLERVSGTLFASRARMTQAVGDFERKHLDARLTGRDPDGAGASAPPEPALPTPLSVAELFAELEFDRYDDFNIFARRAGEIASDLSEVHGELAGLTRVLGGDLAQVQRLTGALRDEIGRARLVPIGALFTRFVRQGQEAARAAGKSVRIQTAGDAVDVDTGIVEQIVDPLLHLVQNAVTHGIESADDRRAAGKPAAGTVTLGAHHHGGFVHIEVRDDGRGIDVEALKARAVAQGFMAAAAAAVLGERQALELMFLPGLSTAAAVTSAAGRGVGMDVVRANVRRLNGDIDVQTEPGVGTRFVLRLPVTVLVSEALLVRVAGETLAVPLNAVQTVTVVDADELRAGARGAVVMVEGAPVDVVPLEGVLALPARLRGTHAHLLVLRAAGGVVAVEVDDVLRKEEIVIKPLGDFLSGVGPFAGATISSDGGVTLLIDPVRLSASNATARVWPAGSSGADAQAWLPAGNARTVAEGSADGRRRVLLVDDSISVRRFVGRMLTGAGFEVVTANDGAEAISKVADDRFDAVITDLEMPRVNGYELIEDLRRRSSTRGVPVIVLTTRAGDKHVSLARRLGVEHYVTKPVDEPAFVRLVASLVSGPAAAER